ncbi:T9SS type B sorting domain-containing protein [Flavobacterium tegetincola]|uniref:T9SS type B sorting domain-containing protein n=1 Tax=Flavobacterium tegetincola TaxID=150172 RepID=UPI00040F83E9|nr:T9SS type B sorting domain-containing protein [Flavobacterium tegetincola]
MKHLHHILAAIIVLAFSNSYGQLGFCSGSKGDPIFTETFGSGTDYGPALAAGITTYPFVSGAPQDGLYTLYHRTNLLQSWHNSPDHTPDEIDGPYGKSLIVNANNNVSGAFYKRTVTGLCINTTFEFSAWVLNVFNRNSSACTTNEIPINVKFEIWNANQTVLLGSGDTGDIFSETSAVWKQFALVFTTTNQTSVVLIMKNNGIGGCGNDLAIDDISFKSCGDLTTVSNPSYPTNMFITCNSPTSIVLNASTSGGSTYFYQWQSSTDNVNWTNIAGQNNATFTSVPVTTTTYYRTRIAQDVANINSAFCSTVSNVFTVEISNGLPPATSNGNQNSCTNQPNPALSVTTDATNSVSWYDQATSGNLLLANSNSYTPTTSGTYYAEVYNASSNCYSTSRTPVTLTIAQVPTATFTGNTTYCSGEDTNITLQSNVAGAIFSWTVIATDVDGAVAGTGNTIAQNLTANGVSGSVTYVVTPAFGGCDGNPINIVVTVSPTPVPLIQDGQICVLGSGIFGIPPYVLQTELSSTNHTFEWFYNGNPIADASGATFSANQLGAYGVIATDINSGCVSDLTVATVSEIPKAQSLTITQSQDFSSNSFINIEVLGGQPPFLYQINDGGFQPSNTFSNLSPGIYEVEVTDGFSCSNLKSLVTIINYPKYFTPNGDGYNDTWTVLNLDDKAKIRIFDRYGKFIIEINSKSESWDGTFNGQQLPADDYWFTVNYSLKGITHEYKNHFSLKR